MSSMRILGDTFYQNGEEGVTIHVSKGDFVKTSDSNNEVTIRFLEEPDFSPCLFLTISDLVKLSQRDIEIPLFITNGILYFKGCKHTFNPPEKGCLKSIKIESVSKSGVLFFHSKYE